MCTFETCPSGSLPFFDVGAIYDSTTLHNILLSTRVPRDSSLLCDRTIYIYTYVAFASSSVRCFVNTRDHHQQQRSRDEKKKTSSSSSSSSSFFGTRQRKLLFFLTSHYLRLFQIPRAFSCSFAARATLLVEFPSRSAYTRPLSRQLFHALKFLGHHVQREVRFRASIVIRRRVPRVPGVLPRLVDHLQHRRLQRRLKRLRRIAVAMGRPTPVMGARGFSAPFTVGSDARHPRRFLLNGEVSLSRFEILDEEGTKRRCLLPKTTSRGRKMKRKRKPRKRVIRRRRRKRIKEEEEEESKKRDNTRKDARVHTKTCLRGGGGGGGGR